MPPRKHSPVEYRRRTSRKGPENDLVEAALQAGIIPNFKRPVVIFLEPKLPLGFPDIVMVDYRVPTSTTIRRNRPLSIRQLQLLNHLYEVKKATVPQLSESLCQTEKSITSQVTQLRADKLVRLNRGFVVPASVKRVFAVEKILAIEAKIHDWRGALRQAIANTWFASHSYILIPSACCSPSVVMKCASHGIGVIAFDGRECFVTQQCRETAIPSSYGSWLFNEWAIEQAS